jgi:hypothetical protein
MLAVSLSFVLLFGGSDADKHFLREMDRVALHFVLDEEPPGWDAACKHCWRSPTASATVIPAPAGQGNGDVLTDLILSGGNDGQCQDESCGHIACKWVGQVRITNNRGNGITYEVRIGSTWQTGVDLSGGSKALAAGMTVTHDLTKELNCAVTGDNTTKVFVQIIAPANPNPPNQPPINQDRELVLTCPSCT